MATDKSADTGGKVFTVTRTFDAPLALVWDAWRLPEHMAGWWGPKGSSITVAAFEFRPGGFFHYGMKYSNGPQMWGRFMFREIVPQSRLVWLNSFSNEGCGITRAPFGQNFPLELHNDVTFTALGQKTQLILVAHPHGASDDERMVFEGMFPSLEQGYGGTMDQLAAHLAQS